MVEQKNDVEQKVTTLNNVNIPPTKNSKSKNHKSGSEKSKKPFRLPTTFTILLFIMLVIVVISWIPGTTMVTVTHEDIQMGNVTIQVADTVEEGYNPAGILDVLLAPMYGFGSKVDIIVFILILGGFLNIIIKSKALDAGIGRLINKMHGKEVWIIPIIMTLFSMGGAIFGMGEETIALYPVLIPMFLAAGFDVITPILVILVGAGIGCMASVLNPFVVSVAVDAVQGAGSSIDQIGNLTVSTGIVFRIISWLLLTSVAITFVMWYALRVKKNELKSPLYDDKEMYIKAFAVAIETPEYTKKRQAIIGIFFSAFILMIIALVSWEDFGVTIFSSFNDTLHSNVPWIQHFYEGLGNWYFMEISALFFAACLVVGFIEWRVPNEDGTVGEVKFVNNFCSGAADILSVCLIISFAAGIGWLFQKTNMQVVLVNNLSSPMAALGVGGFLIVGFLFFLIISVVIPSTSGFAQAVFPILGPVAAKVGLPAGVSAGAASLGTISGTITAFSFANGIVNLIAPTSAILMAGLSISKVSYDKFLKASWPLIVILIASSMLLLGLGSFGVSAGANSIV